MIDIDKIEEAAKRHGNDADWQGAAIAYETHVTPSVVLEMVSLIRLQEAGLNAEQARYESLSEAFASIPAQTGMIGITAAELSAMINWLENGCDPKEAAKKLRLYGERAWTGLQPVQQPAPVDGSDSISLCISDLKNSLVFDTSPEQQECIKAVEARLFAIMDAAPVAAPVVGQEPITLPFPIETEEMTAFRRFYECALDGEGHDVPASMMKSLAGIGLVQRRHASYYETTDFGLAVLDGKFAAPVPAASAQPESDDIAFEEGFKNLMFILKVIAQGPEACDRPHWLAHTVTTMPWVEALSIAGLNAQPDSGRDAALVSDDLRVICDGLALFESDTSSLQDHARCERLQEYFGNYSAATQAAPEVASVPDAAGELDAQRLGKLLQTCTEAKIKYHRDNRVRQITFVIKDSVTTSNGYRDALRKTLDEFQPVDIAAPFQDAKGGAA